MKRIPALLLSILLILSFSSCVSLTQVGDDSGKTKNPVSANENEAHISSSQITFRGIQLGSSYEESIKALESEGLVFENCSSGVDGSYSCNSKNTTNVAGYEARVILYFISPDEKNSLNAEVEDCVLYKAQYMLGGGGSQFWFKDLKSKLDYLYGDTAEFSYPGSSKSYTWKDKDTKVTLKTTTVKFGDPDRVSIDITYIWDVGDTISRNNYRQYFSEKHQEEIEASDKSGL